MRNTPFPCPRCQQSVLPKRFEKHCTQHHHLNTRLQCAWCFGNVSWESKCKCLHTDHLIQCCRSVLKSQVPSSRPPPQSTFDTSPLCPARDLFGKAFDPQPRAYESVWPLTTSAPRILYTLDSLNTASACIQYYLENQHRTEWNHIIVRSIAYQSFLAAIDEDHGGSRTLPFSCWCDGGHYAQDRHRQHRHFIVVSRNRFVSNVWSKVKIDKEDRPNKNFRCIHKKPIKTPLHLLNTLGYLSQSRSSCQFNRPSQIQKDHHYYIFETLPKDFRHALCVLWPEGQNELLHQEYHNFKWDVLLRANLVFHHQKWRLRVKDIPGIRLGLKIPFAPRLKFTTLHLLNGHSFRRGPFYDLMGEEFWTLRPFYQRLVHAFRFYVEAYTRMNAERVQWKQEQDDLTQQMETWKQKYEDAVERERRVLAEQLTASNAKNDQLTAQNQDLNNTIHYLNVVEMVRLKREIEELKKKIT